MQPGISEAEQVVRELVASQVTWPKAVEPTMRHLPLKEVYGRLDEFIALPGNWDSYGADPISRIAIHGARQFIADLNVHLGPELGEGFAPGNVAPIADGGLQLEWDSPRGTLEVEILADGTMAYFVETRVGLRHEVDPASREVVGALVIWFSEA